MRASAFIDEDKGLAWSLILYGIVPASVAAFCISYMIPVVGIGLAEYPVVSAETQYGKLP